MTTKTARQRKIARLRRRRAIARRLRQAPALLGLGLLFGAIYVVQREFQHLKLADIARALAAIPHQALLAGAAITVAAYAVLTLYDCLGTIYAGHRVPYRRVAFVSFCAYALAHNLGFSALSGGAVRFRLYAHWGLTPLQIGKVVAFCSLSFTLGGMLLGGAILFGEPAAVPFFGSHLPHWVLWTIGGALWGVLGAYLAIATTVRKARLFGHEIPMPGWRLALLQPLLAGSDILVTALIFYALLPRAPGLSYLGFLAAYLTSYVAGLAANLPGGIGVFDTAMLLGLAPYLPAAEILGAIAVFRLYYYVVPLFLAGSLFAGNEVLLRARAFRERALRERALRAGASSRPGGPAASGSAAASPLPRSGVAARWSEPDFAVAASTGAVVLCGAMLLSLSLLEPQPDFSWLDPNFAALAADASQYVPSLIGAALIVLAVGLSRRVTLAWVGTILMLLAGAVVTAVQNDPLWIPGVLVFAALLIAPFRDAYYRHARLLTQPLQASTTIQLVALLICIVWLAAFEPHVRDLGQTSWWGIIISPAVPNRVRLALGLAVGLALFALWRLIRPGHVTWLPWAGEGRRRYAALGARPPAEADGVVLGEAGRSGIPFRRLGRVLLGLGDPAGAESDRISAIWRLRDLAQQEGRDPAVWRAGPRLLKIYGGLGLTALPLGSDGLPAPEENVAPCPDTRYLCCVAERDLNLLLPLLPELARCAEAEALEPL